MRYADSSTVDCGRHFFVSKIVIVKFKIIDMLSQKWSGQSWTSWIGSGAYVYIGVQITRSPDNGSLDLVMY